MKTLYHSGDEGDNENDSALDLSEMRIAASEARPHNPAFLKWICFRPDLPADKPIDFTARHVFSCLCDMYFRQKTMPSAVKLRRATGCSHKAVATALADLRVAGIVADCRPVYLEGFFFEKKTFALKRWWKGIQTRTVTPTPPTMQLRSYPDGTTRPAPVKLGIGRDVLIGFVSYANTRRKRITTGYLAKATGMPPRTARRLTSELIEAGRLRSGKAGLEVIVQEAGEVRTLRDHNLRIVSRHLNDCPDAALRKKLLIAGMREATKFFSCLPGARDDAGQTNYHKLLNMMKKAA